MRPLLAAAARQADVAGKAVSSHIRNPALQAPLDPPDLAWL